MTLSFPFKIKCAICNKESEHFVLLSERRSGYSDLDLRPGGHGRENLKFKIQRCPFCGYCAFNISKEALKYFAGKNYSKIVKKISKIISSKAYKRQLNSRSFPKLTNYYLCGAMILEALGEYMAAVHEALSAAWVADDAKKKIAAKKSRLRAVELYKKAIRSGQKFPDKRGTGEAVIADVLRRAGRFNEALKYCEQGLKKKPDEVLFKILNYQKTLIKRHDIKRHTVEEVET